MTAPKHDVRSNAWMSAMLQIGSHYVDRKLSHVPDRVEKLSRTVNREMFYPREALSTFQVKNEAESAILMGRILFQPLLDAKGLIHSACWDEFNRIEVNA
jgi:hypothetical protein